LHAYARIASACDLDLKRRCEQPAPEFDTERDLAGVLGITALSVVRRGQCSDQLVRQAHGVDDTHEDLEPGLLTAGALDPRRCKVRNMRESRQAQNDTLKRTVPRPCDLRARLE
jgi:hypothetical protein